MGKKLNVYNLAEIGLDISASPIHRKFGTLTKAQNAVMLPNEGEGAIEKRGGIAKLNVSAMGGPGAIHGVISLSQQLQTVQRLWVAYENTTTSGYNWCYTTDGTTWVDSNAPAACFQAQRRPVAYRTAYQPGNNRAFRDRLIYPSNDYIIYATAGHGAPPIRIFDGANDYLFGKVPFNQQIQIGAGTTPTNVMEVGAIISFQGLFYFTSLDDSATRRGTVWSMDPYSGQMVRVGNPFAGDAWDVPDHETNRGAPWLLATWGNRLWCVTNNYASGSTPAVFRIRPGVDGTWVNDIDLPTGSYGTGIVSYRGYLWVAIYCDPGATPKTIYRRDASGQYTATDTLVTANTAGYFRPVGFDQKLFVWRHRVVLGVAQTEVRVTADDGTTWADDITDAGLQALIGASPDPSNIATQVEFKGSLYVVDIGTEPTRNGNILKRAAGASPGTWSVVKTAPAGFTGYAAVLTTLE